MPEEAGPRVQFTVDGEQREVVDDGMSLMEALRDRLGCDVVKDGCAPQGQCGCCTVWIDGEARVSCVTPLRRVAGRSVTTLDGLDAARRDEWSRALCATGGSQCGFCTPGIVMRLEALAAGDRLADQTTVERGLAAHLCRCTGWQGIVDAARLMADDSVPTNPFEGRRLLDASRRATLEGHADQRVDLDVPLGAGGFGDDGAPAAAAIAVVDDEGEWHMAPTMSAARAAAHRVQGRRTTVDPEPPFEVPEGDWVLTLRTGWVEVAALEPDASWASPGGEPSSPLANGGAFGAKRTSPLPDVARTLAARTGAPVRARWTREDVVRFGPKRPPMAVGLRADGTGIVRVAATEGVAAAIASAAPGVEVEEVELAGPPTSVDIRAAGWAELAAMRAVLARHDDGTVSVTSPDGATATARIGTDLAGNDGRIAARHPETVTVTVECGDPLDEVVLTSYCIGAAHMALGWVRSEGLAVDPEGEVLDLTIRSFGIVRPGDMPHVEVEIVPSDAEPVCGSDAVFAAVAAAAWMVDDLAPAWPTRVGRS